MIVLGDDSGNKTLMSSTEEFENFIEEQRRKTYNDHVDDMVERQVEYLLGAILTVSMIDSSQDSETSTFQTKTTTPSQLTRMPSQRTNLSKD